MTRGRHPQPEVPGARPGSGWWPLLLGLLVVVQLLVLYTPASGDGAGVPHLDKVVHALLFGAPVLVALLWRELWTVALAMVLHAPVSEVVQARLLPTRSGDGWDMVADITGIVVAVGVFAVIRRRAR